MKLLYIIGNGFDIALGMKTSYIDFYQYYLSQPSKDTDLINLKKDIEKHQYETWADLEMGLGKYTSSTSTPEVFLKCLEDIKMHLREYLKEQFDRRDYNRDYNKLLEELYSPETFLDDQVRTRFDSYLNRFESSYASRRDVSIITLNYTSTIEDILGSRTTYPILHLHGTLDDGMVVGVNNLQQISNKAFQDELDVIEGFVKPEYNDSCLNEKNSKARHLIENANIIVFFGTSLGYSDKSWWKMIGERMIDSKDVLLLAYFPYDKDKDVSLHPNYRRRWNNEYLKRLLYSLDIPIEEMSNVVDRVCIGLNKQIFALKKKSS